MPEVDFKSLQHLHETLLRKQQKVTEENQQEFATDVRDYIEKAKRGGSSISSTRERDQIRANLRYWGNYIYSIDKTFPDTELAPSTVTEKRPIATMITIAVFAALVVLGGVQTYRSVFNLTPETATNTPISIETQTATIPTTIATETASISELNPTPVFVGSDVVLISPENGESVLPKIVFRGAYTNLAADSTIHILLIKNDRLYPVKDFFAIPPDAATGDWEFPATLYLKPEELEKAETLVVVPGACFDDSCREKLAAAVETGIAIEELPSQFSFTLYRDSSRVIYRNAYQAVIGTKLVYSMYKDTSYDLYISPPDGSEVKQITFTPDYSEMFPNISPDGTKIVYVKRFTNPNSDTRMYAISIMDSNGENDYEITGRTNLVLENPQWSPDSAYISYAVVETHESSSTPYSSIHVYLLSSNEDKIISGEPEPFVNRYASWIPNTNIIVFDAGISNRTRFVQTTIDPQDYSIYFDPRQYVSQPNIDLSGNDLMLTYIVVGPGPNYLHDIYMAVDSDSELPFNGVPVRLIISTGELLDYPMVYPDANALYYTKYGSIYRAEYQIIDKQITLTGTSGEVVIETEEIGERVEPIYFDIHYVEAYFPIP